MSGPVLTDHLVNDGLAGFLLGSRSRRVHLIGVAGSGMSGIAALLLGLGHKVSGTDKSDTSEVERLRRKGLEFSGPGTGLGADAELVVYSSAIKAGNADFDAAASSGQMMVKRAEVLAAVMSGKQGVVVCGMHGKTTTSAMAAHVLRAGDLKPSHYVGAEIPVLGTNARWDSEGEHLVAEGDESDGTLVHYRPRHALVLNIEPEHLDHYGSLDEIDAVFSTLISQTTGNVYYWAGDEGAARLCGGRPGTVPVGTSQECHYRLESLVQDGFATRFSVHRFGEKLGEVSLGISGEHNARNAMLVIALACDLGIPFGTVANALSTFRGARRRFEERHHGEGVRIFDDYGHHPTEIRATLATARKGVETGGRLVVLFQPHRYSRTAALREDFGVALRESDLLFVAPVYSAGESPIEGADHVSLVRAARESGHHDAHAACSVAEAGRMAALALREKDLVLTLGAGNIHEAASFLSGELQLAARLRDAMGRGVVRIAEPLRRHTTMKVGGPARFWAEPETEEGFAELVRVSHDSELPLLVIGRGSNLIIRDGGFPGVVVHLCRGRFIEAQVEGERITAGVGVKLKQLAILAKSAGLTGFEWMDGIPGNLGGALRMNAGAMGIQTFDQVISLRFADRDGNIITRLPSEIEVHYREVPVLRDHYALSAVLEGTRSDAGTIESLLGRAISHRKETQPVAASAGCIFKNPEGISAGRLIEELGLKGSSVGDAKVSEIHGNFIVNGGEASASDVLSLINRIRECVHAQRGIRLETEVQILGADPESPSVTP